jgi:hypothetical protein
VLRQSGAFSGALSAISDTNVWLGRSQFEVDAWFSGTFDEFRIYGAALSGVQIQASFDAGPEADLTSE